MNALPLLAITAGEPAGIGPDLCLALADHALAARLIVLGDLQVLRERAACLGRSIHFIEAADNPAHRPGSLCVQSIPVAAAVIAGQLDTRNSQHVLALLDAAIAGCQTKRFDAIVTAPLHKGVINDAGIAFTGHTEYLAQKTATPHVVMMLAGGGMRVALATIHLALKDVPAAITPDGLTQTLRILYAA